MMTLGIVMSTGAIISMITILGLIVGGFAYFLYLVVKKGR